MSDPAPSTPEGAVFPRPTPAADYVEQTVARMAELHAEHYAAQSDLQRRITRLTSYLANPLTVALAALTIAAWVAFNSYASRFGLQPFDDFPFPLLELLTTLAALIVTLMILATQAREEVAARHRAQLTLQLASLSEQKIAKVIQLLEEQRRDSRILPDRIDAQAAEMSEAEDPRHVLGRIRDTHEPTN